MALRFLFFTICFLSVGFLPGQTLIVDPEFDHGWFNENGGNIFGVAIASDGSFLVAAGSGEVNSYELFQLSPDGALNEGYSSPVIVGGARLSNLIALEGGGALIYFGDGKVQKLLENGELDVAFGSLFLDGYPISAVSPTGRVAIGQRVGPTINIIIYLKNGQILARPSIFPAVGVLGLHSLKFQSDDSLLVSGTFWIDTVNGRLRDLVRFDSDGELDETFVPSGSFNVSPDNLTAQLPTGEILIMAISRGQDNQRDGEVIRGTLYSTNGSIDQNFYLNVSLDGLSDPRLPVPILSVESFESSQFILGGQFNFVNGLPAQKISLIHSDGSLNQSLDYGTGPQFEDGREGSIESVLPMTGHRLWVRGQFEKFNGVSAYNNVMLRIIETEPSVLSDGKSYTVEEGFNIELAPKLAGYPIHSIKWLRNGEIFQEGHQERLFIQNIRHEQAGTYSVLISNPLGEVQQTVADIDVIESISTQSLVPNPGFEGIRIVDPPSFLSEAILPLEWIAYGYDRTLNNLQGGYFQGSSYIYEGGPNGAPVYRYGMQFPRDGKQMIPLALSGYLSWDPLRMESNLIRPLEKGEAAEFSAWASLADFNTDELAEFEIILFDENEIPYLLSSFEVGNRTEWIRFSKTFFAPDRIIKIQLRAKETESRNWLGAVFLDYVNLVPLPDFEMELHVVSELSGFPGQRLEAQPSVLNVKYWDGELEYLAESETLDFITIDSESGKIEIIPGLEDEGQNHEVVVTVRNKASGLQQSETIQVTVGYSVGVGFVDVGLEGRIAFPNVPLQIPVRLTLSDALRPQLERIEWRFSLDGERFREPRLILDPPGLSGNLQWNSELGIATVEFLNGFDVVDARWAIEFTNVGGLETRLFPLEITFSDADSPDPNTQINGFTYQSHIVAIGDSPLIWFERGSASSRIQQILFYGIPGQTFEIKTKTSLSPLEPWTLWQSVVLENSLIRIDGTFENSQRYFRVQ